MADEAKKTRSHRKGVVTRTINDIEQYMAEEDLQKVKASEKKIKEKFEIFKQAHEQYHNTLEDDEEIEASDNYYLDVHRTYIEILKVTKQYLRIVDSGSEVNLGSLSGGSSTPAANPIMKSPEIGNILTLMQLPRVDLQPFHGDPLKYHAFMTLFDECVDRVTEDNRAKLARLLQFTKGEAHDTISACVLQGETGYGHARKLLEKRYGNSHIITERTIRSIRQGTPVKTAEDLLKLSNELTQCHAVLLQLGKLHEVESQMCILEVVNRLQPYLRNRWKRQAMEMKCSEDKYPGFKDLVGFVERQAEEASDPVYGSLKTSHQSSNRVKTLSTQAHRPKVDSVPSCVLCKDRHKLFACALFRNMKPTERLKVVNDNKLCHNCLLSNHSTVNCRRDWVCSVPGCGGKHSKYIHIVPSNSGADKVSEAVVTANTFSSKNVFMPIVPVVVNGKVECGALLDTASSNSFCSKSLLKLLKLKGRKMTYCLNTMSKTNESKISEVIDLTLVSTNGENVLVLKDVLVTDHIPVNARSMDELRSFQHLRSLPIATVEGPVQILLGQDNAQALMPLEIRSGGPGEPFAARTIFGWTVNGPGPVGGSTGKSVVSNFISASSLEDKIQSLWNIENEGVYSDEIAHSNEDRLVIDLWEKETRMIDGHYEIPIPWKSGVEVPNNYIVALSRLRSLRKNLDRKSLFDRYKCEIAKLVENGYAELVPDDNIGGNRIWYLPHQAVVTDKKPDKVRVVFDCSAKYYGESLNDKCRQGPDLNNRLLNVLLRFREYPYAVTGDIEAMYHQVRIPPDDRDALRFLWFDSKNEIVTYRMTSHLFGGVWCSSSSTFALRRLLQDNVADDLVVDTVLNSFYVDDCLRSVRSPEEAIKVALGTKELLGKAGFNLTKFITNEPSVLEKIPSKDHAKEVKEFGAAASSRVLGVLWDILEDAFKFRINIEVSDQLSRRTMLSAIASIFDPLGLTNPLVVMGKILFQDATRLRISWDEPVPPDLLQKWNSWVIRLRSVGYLQIPRCVQPADFRVSVVELHHFSDASLQAYGICSYIRCTSEDGRINTALMMSKCKVAPMKAMTIPRLELQAAVLAAQVDGLLRRELTLAIDQSYFWTDSELVLKYINNDTSRFHVFVSNRVSTIKKLSQNSQWNHIPGKCNPADLLTKCQSNLDEDEWFKGPKFLRTPKSQWQFSKGCVSDLSDSDPEVKCRPPPVSTLSSGTGTDALQRLLDRYSSWYRMKRGIAWLLRFKKFLLGREVSKGPLTASEISKAEVSIISFVQKMFYAEELHSIATVSTVKASSPISALSPFQDTSGLLRVGGRLKNAPKGVCSQPILVPHKHHVARCIVSEFHNVAHLGTEWVTSNLRQKFWITRVRCVVKSVARNCVTCKKRFASPCTQKMADLPVERLQPCDAPFTFVGVDCFGPFYVKQGRSEVKRYGCIFTCLSVRAVHLEVLHSLDSDSFLNALRRFIARRGSPTKIFSDRGTNFVGGYNEMVKGVRELDQKILNECTAKGIEWRFNPPQASHMGGIWERLIRTVRKVLTGLFDQKYRMTDEILQTIFCEVEQVVNTRPLTKLSDDVNCESVLTPAHFLIFRGGPMCPPGSFDNSDTYRKRWKFVQHITDQFWKKWLHEYLPELQRRQKWLKVHRNVKVGDIVLICEENTPRYLWPMGLVIETKKGSDGLVRSVIVKTKSKCFLRHVTKIVLLEAAQ